MSAAMYRRFGPPATLMVDEVASPLPGPGQVRAMVRAAGLRRPTASKC